MIRKIFEVIYKNLFNAILAFVSTLTLQAWVISGGYPVTVFSLLFHYILIYIIISLLNNKQPRIIFKFIKISFFDKKKRKELLFLFKEAIILKNGVIISNIYSFYLFVWLVVLLIPLYSGMAFIFDHFLHLEFIEINFDSFLTFRLIELVFVSGLVLTIGWIQKIMQRLGYGGQGHY